jgi:hypothetical protein
MRVMINTSLKGIANLQKFKPVQNFFQKKSAGFKPADPGSI